MLLERTEAGGERQQTELAVAVDLTADDTAAGDAAMAVDPPATVSASNDRFEVRPPVIELAPPLADELDPPAPDRQVRVVALEQLAGPPPIQTLSIEERREAFVEQAAARDDVAEIAEPPFVVTEGQLGSPPLAIGDVIEVSVSFYYCDLGETGDGGDGGGFCGAMRDGTVVYEGAAACALTYLGQQFRIVGDPNGRLYTCHDTGNAVHGVHRDIFFHSAADGWPWLQTVGTRVVLEIVG